MTNPTIRDVARAASVSVASASRAMNGHPNVTETTRERVLDAARRLNYVPHSGARSLTMRQSNTIGVVLPDLFGEFFSEIIRGIDGAARLRGFQLLLAHHDSAAETATAIQAMRGRVDGLLVMSPHLDTNFLANNLPRGFPVVVMNSRAGGAGYTSLSIDSFKGAQAMVEYLVSRGFRRIAHISGPQGNRDAEERLRGFCQAVGDLLGDTDPLILPGDFSEESGREAGRTLVAGQLPVDAVFAANDVMAVGCMLALIDAGVSVPDDISVAGFDDIPIAHYVTPGLTTMQVHIAELGMLALETLVDAIADPDAPAKPARLLNPELVVRQSTGKPR